MKISLLYSVLLAATFTASLSCERRQKTSYANDSDSVIYGEDTRVDVQSLNLDMMGAATAMFVDNFKLKPPYTTLGESLLLCPDEPFQDQPRLGFCTGVLIAPDKVLTAGHCVTGRNTCGTFSILFGVTSDKIGKLKKSDVYSCKAVVAQELTFGKDSKDYAIIHLDRKVQSIQPMRIAKDLNDKEIVFSYSYPLGLPLKKDQSTLFTSQIQQNYFLVNVDTFEGSSGSPLFNAAGEVIGVLSRGAEDILEDDIHRIQTEGGCLNFHRCDKGGYCPGEKFFKANLVPELSI